MITQESGEFHSLEAQIEAANDNLATLVNTGDRHAAAWVLEGLRELTWRRRAVKLRGRRHAGPGLRSLVRRAGHEGA
jgi:hypothetical protein